VPDGIVAQFATPFNLVETGFQLNAGRMQAPFGERDERLIFGIKNMLSTQNVFSFGRPVAYIYFVSLRGLKSTLSSSEEQRDFEAFRRRYSRADDDGPTYPQDD